MFFFFFLGNSKPNHPHGHGHSAIKDLAGSILGCNEDKKDEGELWNTVEAQTAFLGPNLWDKTYESDLKVCITYKYLQGNYPINKRTNTDCDFPRCQAHK